MSNFSLDILLYDAVSFLESENLSYTPMWEEWYKKKMVTFFLRRNVTNLTFSGW